MSDSILVEQKPSKIRAIRLAVRNSFKRFFERPTEGTSRFGLALQLLGVSGVVWGVALVYIPAGFILAGAALLLIGEKL